MEKIPDYKSHHEKLVRGREGITNKITKIYKLSPEESQPDEDLQLELSTAVSKFLHDSEWHQRLNECAKFSGVTLDEPQRKAVDIAANEVMMHFANAFFLRNKVNSLYDRHPPDVRPHDAIFRKYENADSILHLLSSQITWEALSRMQSFGFSDRSTLSLCGFMIRNIRQVYDAVGVGSSAVKPHHGAITSEEVARDRIDEIYRVGYKEAESLAARYKSNRSAGR